MQDIDFGQMKYSWHLIYIINIFLNLCYKALLLLDCSQVLTLTCQSKKAHQCNKSHK